MRLLPIIPAAEEKGLAQMDRVWPSVREVLSSIPRCDLKSLF